MKLLCLMIAGYNKMLGKVLMLARERNLKSFGIFKRGAVSDTFKFLMRESFKEFKPGTKNTVKHEEYFCYVLVHEAGEIGAYAFCDASYPPRVAYNLVNQAL